MKADDLGRTRARRVLSEIAAGKGLDALGAAEALKRSVEGTRQLDPE